MQNKYNDYIFMEEENFNHEKAYIPEKFSIINPAIYVHEGESYFAKSIYDESMLINELIGSYLAKKIDLNAVEYKIGVYYGKLFVLSKLFYKEDFDYDYVGKCKCIYDVKKIDTVYLDDNLPQLFPKLRNRLLKLALLDIKMYQCDRCSDTNIMLKKSKKNDFIDLAPVYDFGFAYPPSFAEKQLYVNKFLVVRKNEESLKLLLEKYPQIEGTLNIIANIDMKTIIKDIQNEHEILIGNDIKNNLITQNNEITKVLKKII